MFADLRKPKGERLTSRTVHDKPAIRKYLAGVSARVGRVSHTPITPAVGSTSPANRTTRPAKPAKYDAFDKLVIPAQPPRCHKLYEELRSCRKAKLANACMVLIRVLLELSVDHYADKRQLSIAGDTDLVLKAELAAFLGELHKAKMAVSGTVKTVLKNGAKRPPSLPDKLNVVVADLVTRKKLSQKEATHILQQLSEKDVLLVLNGAVHRLSSAPNMTRVDDMLEIVGPVFNPLHT
jgi:hypothetical protein